MFCGEIVMSVIKHGNNSHHPLTTLRQYPNSFNIFIKTYDEFFYANTMKLYVQYFFPNPRRPTFLESPENSPELVIGNLWSALGLRENDLIQMLRNRM